MVVLVTDCSWYVLGVQWYTEAYRTNTHPAKQYNVMELSCLLTRPAVTITYRHTPLAPVPILPIQWRSGISLQGMQKN